MDEEYDEDLRRAIAASLADQEQDKHRKQAAIRQSRLDYFENKLGSKRKLEDDQEIKNPKRTSPPRVSPPRLVKRPRQEQVAQARPSTAKITYPSGALRITRTPGRRNAKNCVNLEDVIHGRDLVSACCFSFYISEDEFYQHLPLSHSSDAVPIYIGRDANMDPLVQEACRRSNDVFNNKLSNKQLQSITPALEELYQKQYGKNYHAFYAWSPGSSHSKILFLVYPDFARLVITSCNFMNIDTVLGDNHWYVHDLPKYDSCQASELSTFETDFLAHLQALNTPEAFLSTIRGWYDYSAVNVHLVTSVPGVSSGPKAEKHGLLRLRRVIKDLDLDLEQLEESDQLQLDMCAASIGNLSVKWLSGFSSCALGKDPATTPDDSDISKLRIFYPTVGDVQSADEVAQHGASNIGCHTRPWNQAPPAIKDLFHHYRSKDNGKLFHQKFILAWNKQDPKALPYFAYIGSANLSQSAWGALEADKKKNAVTRDTKLIKTSNFECGVVIPGHLIAGMLEEGTKDWQTGIVSFIQSGAKYDLSTDRPWNDPRWVQGYEEDWTGR